MRDPTPPAARRVADARLLFTPARLTLARRLRGVRKNQLAALIGTTPTAVGQYEAGSQRPSGPTLARLAAALGVPVEFFAATGTGPGVDAADAHFRSLRSTSQLDRDQALSYGGLAVDIAAVVDRYAELPVPAIPSQPVPLTGGVGEPAAAARLARARLGLPAGPVRHAVRLLENHGVLVLTLPDLAPALDAFSVSAQPRPLVLLNPAKDDYYRRRFDAAHELGHLVMHADAEPGNRVVEDQANRFAAEFLLPADEIAGQLPRTVRWHALDELKQRWGVSLAALLYRARTLGILPETRYRSAMSTMSKRGWRRHEPGPRPPVEQPALLTAAVELLTAAGIDRDRLAELARITRADLDRLIPLRRPPAPPGD